MKIVAGIDYSMTSPAICIHRGNEWSLDNCKFYFRTDKKKLELKTAQFQSAFIEPWTSNEERFAAGAAWAGAVLSVAKPEAVTLEGYAMGAKGLVFHIGENTGQLKQILWKQGLKFDVPAPSAIKKFATGKGNANKEKMEEAFVAETGFNLRPLLGQTDLSFTPSADIIDSYYMAKWAFAKAK
jgi:Holliday junction resolvasome RuvABC endonuclease subunit